MFSRSKLLHHSHTGRLRPHEHTSYGALLALLTIVGLALAISTATAASPGPEAGSIGLNGAMPGPAPTTAAVITSPRNGQRFGTTPVNVSGTCPKGTLVEVFKNDIFAGSSACDDRGTFSMEIDLLIGQNILIARVFDALNQAGPDSGSVTVFYDALPPQAGALSPMSFGGDQMLITTDAVFRGAFPDKQMLIPITIVGGVSPFAVNVQWGDSTNKVIPRNDNIPFKADHVYKKPGTFQITLQATDSQGRVAFMTVASIVNGQPTGVTSGGTNPQTESKILLLWPFFVSAVAVVIAFWLGERREKHILLRGPAYTSRAT